jgi:hypothetical protein
MKKRNQNNSNPGIKICPLLDRPCLEKGCSFYHVDFEKCLVDVLQYNLYALKKALQSQGE